MDRPASAAPRTSRRTVDDGDRIDAARLGVLARDRPPTGRPAWAGTVAAVALASLIVLASAGSISDGSDAPPAAERQDGPSALAKQAAGYRIGSAGGPVASLEAGPAIRWNKPSSQIEDAALFFWTSRGRPVAAGTFLRQQGVGLYHEFQSLSAGPLVGECEDRPPWRPSKPGLRFSPVPDATPPADTRNRRLVQMRALAGEFRTQSVNGPPFYSEGSVYKFRLLSKPLLTYEDPARPGHDGAVFGFVHDTDPEVLLLLEVRDPGTGPRWEFALAPMTGWSAKGWHKDREVWSVERRHPGHDPNQPYYVAGPFPTE